jgi:hypothetical protein
MQPSLQKKTQAKRLPRDEAAQKLAYYKAKMNEGSSERSLAEELGIPRSTLQHWRTRKDSIDAAPEVIAFFESPVGVAFLHRLVLAAQFVITLMGANGIRLVCMFLELAGLDQFVASSYGSQQKVSVKMEEAVVQFGEGERKRLGVKMPPRKITLCEDETFHPAICLVAIEPVSNFILLEKYAEDRSAATWSKAVNEALYDLPVEVIQGTSDEAKGILRHIEKELGAHHSPDVFHVQHELVKATSGALAAKVKNADTAVSEANAKLEQQEQKQLAYEQKKQTGQTPRGRPPEFGKRIEAAREKVKEAKYEAAQSKARQTQAQEAIRGIGTDYHPYDLETGRPQTTETVADKLEGHFATLEMTAENAQLGPRSQTKIAKAKKVMTDMLATITFYWMTINAKIEALGLTPEQEQALHQHLIPGIYLDLVADKTTQAENKRILKQRAEALLAPIRDSQSLLKGLDSDELKNIERVAKECAQLFQRSSSCVEGRNGQLALHHHSLHRLSDRKLASLTVVHNYYVKREDGTTAAERFFGAKPRDLFEYLLGQIDLPRRPASKRSEPIPKSYVLPLAA